MAKENKTIYVIALIVVSFLLFTQLSGENQITDPEDEVLPSPKHCLEAGLNVSYYETGDTTSPIEYCKLEDFCDNYAVSIVLEDEPFDIKMLSMKENEWEKFGTCFKEEANHTQKNFPKPNPDGKTIKAMYLCCNSDVTCKPNDCNGTFTGIKDEAGCKLYAYELCKASTECKSIDGKRVCDPQPFIDGCTWETKSEFGKTFFTKFNNCGLEIEQPCGTVSKYRCTNDPEVLCNMEYNYPTGKYIEACGGYDG